MLNSRDDKNTPAQSFASLLQVSTCRASRLVCMENLIKSSYDKQFNGIRIDLQHKDIGLRFLH